MELFRNTNIPFLKYKRYSLALSLLFCAASILSMLFWHGVPLGVDFRGGTLVYVKFAHTPDENHVRSALDRANLRNAKIQRYGPASNNEVLISLEQKETSEAALDLGKNQIIQALVHSNAPDGKQDLNNASVQSVQEYLVSKDPLHNGGDSRVYASLAREIVDVRDTEHSGVLTSMEQLRGAAPNEVLKSLEESYFLSDLGVRNVEIVGPQVGKQLQNQAKWAILYSLVGMLVYLWFRFELIYGVAAVVAVFHDTLITIGAFSLTNKEISLTVIAAVLTLVGYSMNDTIVIFDRIRENLKMMRREKLGEIVDRSINQTLNRTALTSGLTFLTVLSLFLFGGEVLHGFSFALVIGIIIGTYSSIFIASPMLVAYQDWRSARKRVMGAPETKTREKAKAKA